MKNRVKQYRLESGMSQADLAVKASVARSYITMLEEGKRSNPSYLVMLKISEALGKGVTEVFFPEYL